MARQRRPQYNRPTPGRGCIDSTMKETKDRSFLLISPAAMWLVVFFIGPLVVILVVSFASRGAFGRIIYDYTLGNYARAFDSLYVSAYWRTVWIATLTTLLCIVMSYPAAYYLAFRASGRWKPLLLVLTVVPFWTSFLIRTYAWMVLLRSEGLINSGLVHAGIIKEPLGLLYNNFAVMVGQVYGELPFMILPIFVALDHIDKRLIEAAHDLGANRISTFTRVTLPLSRPGLIAGSVLVFIPSLGAFVTPDLLGGAKSAMIGNLIQNQFTLLNQPFGSALSILLGIAVLMLLAAALKMGLKPDELA